LRLKGFGKSRTFTWEKAAQKTLEIYEKVFAAGEMRVH
jgi:hypothetical protein